MSEAVDVDIDKLSLREAEPSKDGKSNANDEGSLEKTSANNGDNVAGIEKCTSSVDPNAAKWELEKPKGYVYEEEYLVDGKVDDLVEKPELVNRFTNIPARLFNLRGPDYLNEETTNNVKLKIPSEYAAYTCVGLNVFQSKNSLEHAATKIESLKQFLETQKNSGDSSNDDAESLPQYLVVCWGFSNFFKTEFTSVVHVLKKNMDVKSVDPTLHQLFSKWLKLDESGKNEKLKYCCTLREGNSQIKSAVEMLGGERPVIIGKRLTTNYYKGTNYLEIDMDVGSSHVASMLNGIVLKSSGAFVIDECFCIEGQTQEELPERALFCIRWNHCSLESCRFQLDGMGNIV